MLAFLALALLNVFLAFIALFATFKSSDAHQWVPSMPVQAALTATVYE